MRIRISGTDVATYEADVALENISFALLLEDEQAVSVTMKFKNGHEIVYERVQP